MYFPDWPVFVLFFCFTNCNRHFNQFAKKIKNLVLFLKPDLNINS
jgi:hypothetical protein